MRIHCRSAIIYRWRSWWPAAKCTTSMLDCYLVRDHYHRSLEDIGCLDVLPIPEHPHSSRVQTEDAPNAQLQCCESMQCKLPPASKMHSVSSRAHLACGHVFQRLVPLVASQEMLTPTKWAAIAWDASRWIVYVWPLLPTSVQKANNFKYELQSFYLYKVHESRRCVTKIVGHCFYFRGPIVDL